MEIKSKSSEELAKLLEEKQDGSKEAPVLSSSSIESFIRDMQIGDGQHFCENYLLYDLYLKDWKPSGEKKVGKKTFMQELNKFFPQRRKTKARGYLVNQVFDEDRRLLAKRRDLRRAEAKKNVKAKQAEVSEPNEGLHSPESPALS